MLNAPTFSRRLRILLPAAAVLALTACGTINNYVPSFIQPYRPDVQQGNWLTQDQVDLLRPGMTREQVRFALGSPTLTSIFRSDRWYYPYLFTPGHGQTEERQFTVYFVDDRLDHWSGDPVPVRQPFQTQDPPRASLGAPAQPAAPTSAPAVAPAPAPEAASATPSAAQPADPAGAPASSAPAAPAAGPSLNERLTDPATPKE